MSEEERRGRGSEKISSLFLDYIEDIKLTEAQQDLKWRVFTECEWETISDIQKVLESLFDDLKKIENGSK